MTLAVGRDFELSLRLGAPDLTGSALVPRFVLRALGAREHLARRGDSCFTLSDPGLDFASIRSDGFDSRNRGRDALGESVDQGTRFGGLTDSALMLAREGSRAVRGVSILSRGLCR